MGTFNLNVTAVGGHGCKREPRTGERVYGCRRLDCPDCVCADFVERMSRISADVKARFTHWPGETSEVVDELTVSQTGRVEVTRVKGQF